MVSDLLFSNLDAVARTIRNRPDKPFGGIKLVLSGDFAQLPPVSSEPSKYLQASGGGGGGGGGNGGGDPTGVVGVGAAGDRASFAFQSPSWADCIQPRDVFDFKTVFRQHKDAAFVRILQQARFGQLSQESVDILRTRCVAAQQPQPTCGTAAVGEEGGPVQLPTMLFTHRSQVEVENGKQLQALGGDAHTFEMRISDNGGNCSEARLKALVASCPAKRRLRLKVGAEVILVRSVAPRDGLVNGARGVVVRFSEPLQSGSAAARSVSGPSAGKAAGNPPVTTSSCIIRPGLPVVRFQNGQEVTVRPETWIENQPTGSGGSSSGSGGAFVKQIPLELAWAISIHKAQGLSLPAVEIDLTKTFEAGQAYVALSRATSLSGLTLRGSLNPAAIRAHPAVTQFYRSLPQAVNNDEL